MVVVSVSVQSSACSPDLAVQECQTVSDGQREYQHVVVVQRVLREEVVERAELVVLRYQPEFGPVT